MSEPDRPGDDRKPPAETTPRPSIARRYGWPFGIALTLLLSAGSNVAVMFVARADPAFAVEPDYYRKAVTWDSTLAQHGRNAALQWTARVSLVLAKPGVPGAVSVELLDADGSAIKGAAVSIEAMHNARASQRYQAVLSDDGHGRYVSPIDAHRPGAWEVRVSADRVPDRFTQSVRLDAR